VAESVAGSSADGVTPFSPFFFVRDRERKGEADKVLIFIVLSPSFLIVII
jgi:hypothetical protein